MKHTLYRCTECRIPNMCQWCDGGLAYCTTCGGAESSLLAHCPGFRMSPEAEEAVSKGQVVDIEEGRYRRNARIAREKGVFVP